MVSNFNFVGKIVPRCFSIVYKIARLSSELITVFFSLMQSIFSNFFDWHIPVYYKKRILLLFVFQSQVSIILSFYLKMLISCAFFSTRSCCCVVFGYHFDVLFQHVSTSYLLNVYGSYFTVCLNIFGQDRIRPFRNLLNTFSFASSFLLDILIDVAVTFYHVMELFGDRKSLIRFNSSCILSNIAVLSCIIKKTLSSLLHLLK